MQRLDHEAFEYLTKGTLRSADFAQVVNAIEEIFFWGGVFFDLPLVTQMRCTDTSDATHP